MFVGDNHILAEIKSFDYEDDIIMRGSIEDGCVEN